MNKCPYCGSNRFYVDVPAMQTMVISDDQPEGQPVRLSVDDPASSTADRSRKCVLCGHVFNALIPKHSHCKVCFMPVDQYVELTRSIGNAKPLPDLSFTAKYQDGKTMKVLFGTHRDPAMAQTEFADGILVVLLDVNGNVIHSEHIDLTDPADALRDFVCLNGNQVYHLALELNQDINEHDIEQALTQGVLRLRCGDEGGIIAAAQNNPDAWLTPNDDRATQFQEVNEYINAAGYQNIIAAIHQTLESFRLPGPAIDGADIPHTDADEYAYWVSYLQENLEPEPQS